MAQPRKITKDEISALVNTTHHEPRSLLGYHEYPQARRDAAVRGARARAGRRNHRRVLGRHPDELASAQANSRSRAVRRQHPASPPGGAVPTARALSVRSRRRQARHLFLLARALGFRPLSIRRRAGTTACITSSARICACATASPARSFAVWAPNAKRVSVVGSFNGWDGRKHAMQARGGSGVWELFVPGVGEGAEYKYEIRTQTRCAAAQVRSFRLLHADAARDRLDRRFARRLRME